MKLRKKRKRRSGRNIRKVGEMRKEGEREEFIQPVPLLDSTLMCFSQLLWIFIFTDSHLPTSLQNWEAWWESLHRHVCLTIFTWHAILTLIYAGPCVSSSFLYGVEFHMIHQYHNLCIHLFVMKLSCFQFGIGSMTKIVPLVKTKIIF